MKNIDTQNFEPLFIEMVNIWKSFCELHFSLFETTADEYTSLLSGNIEKLEELTSIKNSTIKQIELLENRRQNLIQDIQKNHSTLTIQTVSDLIIFFDRNASPNLSKHFHSFNSLLKDLIEKIKEQNKKNQLFLNKAIFHLQDLRETALGKKNNPTYNSKGKMAALPSSR